MRPSQSYESWAYLSKQRKTPANYFTQTVVFSPSENSAKEPISVSNGEKVRPPFYALLTTAGACIGDVPHGAANDFRYYALQWVEERLKNVGQEQLGAFEEKLAAA